MLITAWFFVALNDIEVTLTVTAFGEEAIEYLVWLVLTPVLVLGFHYSLQAIES